jgi:hypothetical protein
VFSPNAIVDAGALETTLCEGKPVKVIVPALVTGEPETAIPKTALEMAMLVTPPPTPEGVAQVRSPLKKVVASAVPEVAAKV